MIRKVRTSIRTKLIVFVSFLIVSTIVAMVYYAVDKFREDKKAYISSEIQTTTSTIKNTVEGFISTHLKNAILIAATREVTNRFGQPLDKGIFKANPSFAQVKVVNAETMERNFNLTNKQNLNQKDLDEIESVDDSESIQDAVKSKKPVIKISLGKYIMISHYIEQSNEVIVSRINTTELNRTLKQYPSLQIDLIDKNANIYASNHVVKYQNLKSEAFIKSILKSRSPESVMAMTDSFNEQYIIGYNKSSLGFITVARISEKKAYGLIEKFLMNSTIIAGALIIFGLFFTFILASSLTRPISTLMLGTQELAKRNFGVEVDIPSNDEIGVLADSFNYMANEILTYVDAIQDKARMENELAVAQLVQSSFFPPEHLKTGHLDVHGFYQSASECGGDWWGYHDTEDKLVIYIGDATGHGVPAALITATAHCSMKILQKFAPALIGRPDGILKLMNHAIHQAGGNIFMTFFIGVIDKKTNMLYYSNASHNPPFIYRNSENEPSKGDIDVLMDAVSTRLGHKKDAKFGLARTQLNPGDTILLYTDGIVEGENPDKKQWGERRFIKSFLSNVKKSPENVIHTVLKDSAEFYQGVEVDDDITLLVTKVS